MKKAKKTKDPLCDAVRKLRTALGESQQAFAYRMKTAIRTIARYEASTPPKGKALAELFWVAADTGNAELANVFRGALVGEIGVVGKFTQLGALASHTIPGIHADLALMLNDFKNGSDDPEVKIANAIERLERIVPEMDKLNLHLPRPTGMAKEDGMNGCDFQAPTPLGYDHLGVQVRCGPRSEGKALYRQKSGYETKTAASAAMRDAIIEYEKTHGKVTKHRGILGTVTWGYEFGDGKKAGFADRTAAEAELTKEIERRAAAEQVPAEVDPTFAEYVGYWLDKHASRTLAPKTSGALPRICRVPDSPSRQNAAK